MKLHKWLKTSNYPSFPISLDETEISIFDFYLGGILFAESKKEKAKKDASFDPYAFMFWLNAACNKNLFHALKERMDVYYKLLKNNTDDGLEEKFIEKIRLDVEKLNKHYGSTGYFYSAHILAKVATFGNNNQQKRKAWLETAENLLCAQELISCSLNKDKELINAIRQGKGLEVCFGMSFPQAEEKILKPLARLSQPLFTNIYNKAKDKIMLKKILQH
jgi:hypothetical protein